MARKRRLKDDWTTELIDIELIQEEFVEEYVYELTPEEREAVEEGIRQSKARLGIPREIVRAEVRQWLTAEQLKDIEIGRKQMAAGEWISHEDFMRELEEEWS